MVAPCASGTGVPRPGFERAVNVTAAAVEGVLTAIAGPEAAIFLSPIIASQQYDLSQICTTGDPGDPGLGPQDYVDAADVGGNIVANGAAWLKIRQWFLHIMWPTWCECSDGTVLSAPTISPVPQPTLNPGMPVGPTGSSCWDVTRTFPSFSGTTTWGNAIFPRTQDIPGTYTNGGQPQVFPSPRPTNVLCSVTAHHTNPSAPLWAWILQSIDASGAPDGGNSLFSPSLSGDVNYTAQTVISAIGAGYRLILSNNVPFYAPQEFEVHVTYTCPGQGPLTITTPCCPPDPSVESRLNYLIQLAHANIALSGQALKGHVDGTRHAGLTAAGTVTLVDSVLAVRVEIKTGLGSLELNPGSPNYYFSAGFITPIAAGSPLKGARLVYAAQTYPVPSFTDQIGFTLPPGVSIDIVELLPAP